MSSLDFTALDLIIENTCLRLDAINKDYKVVEVVKDVPCVRCQEQRVTEELMRRVSGANIGMTSSLGSPLSPFGLTNIDILSNAALGAIGQHTGLYR